MSTEATVDKMLKCKSLKVLKWTKKKAKPNIDKIMKILKI